jgi:FtsH-binding integral membrane protein
MERYQTNYNSIVNVQPGVMRGVYAWMGGGLLLTAFISLMTASSPALLQAVLGNRMLFYALIFGELGLVVAISAAINKISAPTASLLFLVYAALNGVTMSTIFVAYTSSSIASTFLVTSCMFGSMSLYGYLTKSDLSSWGSFLFMGLVGVVIASLVNIFLHSPMISWVLSICSVIVFTGLTAYDTQRIKAQGYSGQKGAILGALTLYLDFINMFLSMLRLFGDRR